MAKFKYVMLPLESLIDPFGYNMLSMPLDTDTHLTPIMQTFVGSEQDPDPRHPMDNMGRLDYKSSDRTQEQGDHENEQPNLSVKKLVPMMLLGAIIWSMV